MNKVPQRPVSPPKTLFVYRYPICKKCGQMARQTCSICNIAHYCSSDCQKNDWAVHKKICQGIE